jgi:hypothetical protein
MPQATVHVIRSFRYFMPAIIPLAHEKAARRRLGVQYPIWILGKLCDVTPASGYTAGHGL